MAINVGNILVDHVAKIVLNPEIKDCGDDFVIKTFSLSKEELPDDLLWTWEYEPIICYCYFALPHDDPHWLPTPDHRNVCLVLKGDHILFTSDSPQSVAKDYYGILDSMVTNAPPPKGVRREPLNPSVAFAFNPRFEHWLLSPSASPGEPFHTTLDPEDLYIHLLWIVHKSQVKKFLEKLKLNISGLNNIINLSEG